MRRFPLLLLAVGLHGCAPSTLVTRVEVYSPKARLQELRSAARKESPDRRLETLLTERVAAEARTEAAIDELLRRVAALRSLPGDAWDVYEKQVAAVERNEVFLQGVRAARSAHVGNAEDVIEKASEELTTLQGSRKAGLVLASQASFEMRRIAEELRVSLEAALSPASVVAKGDPAAIPPALKDALDGAVIRLGPELAKASGVTVVKARDRGPYLERLLRIPRDLAGIERRNTFEETVTDPLLTLALNDSEGWKAVPMLVHASTEGKSEVALVRETPDSFSVFALSNDPSGLFRQRLRIASSTVNLLSKLATSYFGLPAGPEAATGSSTKTQAEPETEMAGTVPASARIRIAERRLVEVEDLLRQTPTGPAEVRSWVTRANALLESERR